MWDDRTDGMIVRDVGRASTMFQVLVHAKLSHDDVLRMHATDHHMGKKKAKCSKAHPCTVRDPDPFDVQVGVAASEGACCACVCRLSAAFSAVHCHGQTA